ATVSCSNWRSASRAFSALKWTTTNSAILESRSASGRGTNSFRSDQKCSVHCRVAGGGSAARDVFSHEQNAIGRAMRRPGFGAATTSDATPFAVIEYGHGSLRNAQPIGGSGGQNNKRPRLPA